MNDYSGSERGLGGNFRSASRDGQDYVPNHEDGEEDDAHQFRGYQEDYEEEHPENTFYNPDPEQIQEGSNRGSGEH